MQNEETTDFIELGQYRPSSQKSLTRTALMYLSWRTMRSLKKCSIELISSYVTRWKSSLAKSLSNIWTIRNSRRNKLRKLKRSKRSQVRVINRKEMRLNISVGLSRRILKLDWLKNLRMRHWKWLNFKNKVCNNNDKSRTKQNNKS
jgi:hypothetical protein